MSQTQASWDTLQRHRANAVMDAVWGLYNDERGMDEPRSWQSLTTLPSSGVVTGTTSVLDDYGGTREANVRVQAIRPEVAGALVIAIPKLKVPGIEAPTIAPHVLTLFRGDYERAVAAMPGRWHEEHRRFERSARLNSPFGLVVKRAARTIYYRQNTTTSDALMCAALFLTEACES